MNINIRNSFKCMFYLALACATTFAASGATAQSTQEEESNGIEEVIVTATRRTESLQDIGMAVTVVDSQELERLGATSLIDVAVRVPNLGMAYANNAGRFDASSPSIRGIFGNNTTGFYIDDTPVKSSMLPRVIDIERVEVLRGPQGSLWGSNSMGGTIRLITKQPDMAQSHGTVHTTLSSVKEGDQNYNFDGAVNVPLVEDAVALRINAYYGSNSGIFDREYIPSWVDRFGNDRESPGPAFETNKNVDDEKYWGGQIAFKAMITDNLDLTLKWMGQKVEADGFPFADIAAKNTTEQRFFNIEEPGSDKWSIANATLNWKTEAGSFVSTTSLYDRKVDESEEQTSILHWVFGAAIPIPIDPLVSVATQKEKFDSFVQEVRFSSDFDGALNFTAGAFYQHEKHHHSYPRSVATGLADSIDEFTGVPGLGQNCDYGFCLTDDDLIWVQKRYSDTKEKALFGELTWEINDVWSLTAGGRWYDTKLHVKSEQDGFVNGGFTSWDVRQSESGFNPKVLLQAKINGDLNLYASASKGFRIGGVNSGLPESLCGAEIAALGLTGQQTNTYGSDDLWSYELGFKSTLADKRVTLNGAVYFVDWTDIQQVNRLQCGYTFTANAGAAESKGFELELLAAPIDGLTLSAGVGYTDAEIVEAGGVSGVAVGDKIQGVPDWTATATAEYMWPAFGDWNGLLRADGNYYGDSFSANNETIGANARLRKSWSALNLRAGIVNKSWDLILFVDNVTDERANLGDARSLAAETPGRQRLVVNRPRTVGVEARWRFN